MKINSTRLCFAVAALVTAVFSSNLDAGCGPAHSREVRRLRGITGGYLILGDGHGLATGKTTVSSF